MTTTHDTDMRMHKADLALDERSETLRWKGTWNQLLGRAKRLWGTLTDADLTVAEGRYEELLGRIQKRTGETLARIRSKLFA